MERLSSSKFVPLSKKQMQLIFGGTKTEGLTKPTGIVNVYERDGKYYSQAQVKSYTADDWDGKTMCYTDLEYCWGPEEPYNPPRG